MSGLVAASGSSKTIIKGGVVLPWNGLIKLVAYLSGATKRCTFRKFGGTAVTAGYTPSGTNKFICKALETNFSITARAAGVDIVLAQSDNDLGIDTTTAFTNPVYPGGSSIFTLINAAGMPTQDVGTISVPTFDFQILNGKYAGVEGYASLGVKTIFLYGYESA